MTTTRVTRAQAREVASRCEDAYSFGRYSKAGWVGSALLLLKAGLSEAETEEVLRSKIMRWAADWDGGAYGRVTSGPLRRYLTRVGVDNVQADAAKWVREFNRWWPMRGPEEGSVL